MHMPTLPRIKSFLVADQVFRQDNGKWCVIGIFENILAPRYPTIHPSMGLYVKLADAHGSYDVRLEFKDSSGKCLAFFEGMQLEASDRLAEPGFGFQVHQLPIPKAGTYFINIFFNNQQAETDIMVQAFELEPPE